MTKKNFESCEICGDETGCAGKGDDSLYGTWAISPPTLTTRKEGDEIGPLCSECYDCLSIVGMIEI